MNEYFKLFLMIFSILVSITLFVISCYCIIFNWHHDASFGLAAMAWIWAQEANTIANKYKDELKEKVDTYKYYDI